MSERAARVPPHALEAEMSVLGGLMLDNRKWEDVEDVLVETDFYNEAHRLIFRAIRALAATGKRFDWVTVSEWLRDDREDDRKGNPQGLDSLERVGGQGVLAQIAMDVPGASNVEAYAEIVKERSIQRQLIATGLDIVSLGQQTDGRKAPDLVDEAERKLFGIRQKASQKETAKRSGDTIMQLVDSLPARRNNDAARGLSTGFVDLDRRIKGMKPGQLIIVGGRPSMGKAQPIDEPILTPNGFRPIGEISVGDFVIGSSGKPTRVIGVYPRGELPAFRVWFSDGTSTRCCGDHLWLTQTRNERRQRRPAWSVKSTDEIARTIYRPGTSMPTHIVPFCQAVEFSEPTVSLPLDAWLLGALIGDGNFQTNVIFSKPEKDVLDRVASLLPEQDCVSQDRGGISIRIRRKKRNHEKSETAKALVDLGLYGAESYQRFIPSIYMESSIKDRQRLLMGLLDTDGNVCGKGAIEFSTSAPRLAEDVAHLARGLGALVTVAAPRVTFFTHKNEEKPGRPSWRMIIRFPNGFVPISSDKHLAKWVPRPPHSGHKSISIIEPIGSHECVCIRVEAEDSLYVTKDFIVTHNSTLAMNIADHVACLQGQPVAVFSLEMGIMELQERQLSSIGRVPLEHIQSGELEDDEYGALTYASGLIHSAKIFIDDTAALTPLEIRSRARRIAAKHGLGLIVVDYIQLMQVTDAESQTHATGIISGSLKQLAKELNVPVIAISQLNRGLEVRDNKRPRMADLRQSGAIEQDADVIIFVYRDDVYMEDGQVSPWAGTAEAIVAKQRGGSTGTERLVSSLHLARFDNMEPHVRREMEEMNRPKTAGTRERKPGLSKSKAKPEFSPMPNEVDR